MENNELKTRIIKNVKENIAVSNIRKELDMDKFYKLVLAACAVFVISAVIITNNNFLDNNFSKDYKEPNIDDKLIVSSTDGIKIPKLKITEPSLTQETSMISFIVYKGDMYVCTQIISIDKANKLKGKYLGETRPVYNEYLKSDYYKNATSTGLPHIEDFIQEKTKENPDIIWSIAESDKVYEVNGYSTDFRICCLDEINNQIIIYEKLNNITVKYGKDLYEERVKLKENYEFVEYQYHQDWDNGKNNFKKFTEVTTEDIEQFIDEINNAEFIEGRNLDFYSIKKKQAHLYFRMKDGTTVNIRLNEDGYVSYSGWSARIFVKLDTETFRKIFNEAIPENYTYSDGK